MSFFTISVLPFLVDSGVVGTVYSRQLSATPALGAYSFAVTGGALPPGLSLSAAGLLTGRPAAAGDFTFTVTATLAPGEAGVKSYSISVKPAAVPLSIGGRDDGAAYQYTPDDAGKLTLTGVTDPFTHTGYSSRIATADLNGDGVPDTIFVTGPGTPVRLSTVSGIDGSRMLLPFDPFGGNFTGGAFVAAADLDGDGQAEIIVAPDEGGGPRVAIFSLSKYGDPVKRASYFTVDPDFRGGARVAAGDINGDGTPRSRGRRRVRRRAARRRHRR